MFGVKEQVRRIQKAGDKLEAYADVLEIMTSDQLAFAAEGRSPSASVYLERLTDKIRELGRPYQKTIRE